MRRLKLRLDGAELSVADLDGAGQKLDGNVIEIVDPRVAEAGSAESRSAARISPPSR